MRSVLLLVAALYLVLQVVATVLFGVIVEMTAMPVDLALHAGAAAVLFALSRRRSLFLALVLLLFGGLHLGMAAKIAVFGGPITPDDFAAAPALFQILPVLQQGLVLAVLTAVIMVFLANISLRAPLARRALAVCGVFALPLFLAPSWLVERLDRIFGNVEWNQRGNYEARGPLLYLVNETARDAARRTEPPTRTAVFDAIGSLIPSLQPASFQDPTVQPARLRNVHFIVLESFWDPSLLISAGLTRDPWAPEFRALWEAGGRSRVLSPVFGGYTANAEFEALCGLPINKNGVIFEGTLRNDVPCLPQHLSAMGYEAAASHPNIASFWNRANAYRRMGFTTYWSARDFIADDLNGEFLSDSSLYGQVLGKVGPLLETGTLLFNYVLTLSGHLDYPLNTHRPPVIEAITDDELVVRYVNTVYYKSRELMAFLAELQERDPDALIVVIGDHLPYLGNEFGPYVDSGLLARAFEDFTPHMWLTFTATPLIVIDGRRGPVSVGTIPMYRLPAMVLDLLEDWRLSLLRLATLGEEAGVNLRPLPGLTVVISSDDSVTVCRAGSEDRECDSIATRQKFIETIAADILGGRQHILREILLPRDISPVLSLPPKT